MINKDQFVNVPDSSFHHQMSPAVIKKGYSGVAASVAGTGKSMYL